MKSSGKAVVIGLARQGAALVRYLTRHGFQVLVNDIRDAYALVPVLDMLSDCEFELVLGDHPPSILDGASTLFVSGGVPLELPVIQEARKRSIPISNDSQLFLELCPAKVVAITGSSGKTTTTALLGDICQRDAVDKPHRVWVGGNIGNPLLDVVEQIEPDDIVVSELSSFQLELMTSPVSVAGLLNITPNHLDRHKTLEAYTAAKARLLQYQEEDSVAVLNLDDPGSHALSSSVKGRKRLFSLSQTVKDGAYIENDEIFLVDPGTLPRSVCHTSQVKLRGKHNLANVLAACVLADTVGVSIESLKASIGSFLGVDHRMELVSTYGNAQWINDSIATTPERLIAALLSYDEPIVLLAGGRDKYLPWEKAALLMKQRARKVILFGEAADLIKTHLDQAQHPQVTVVENLGEAVAKASIGVREGDVVLLSPGGTSFDAYADFAERGDDFRRLVEAL
ncbi:MAG: UDP-N-acetylmuramoyl-L-alanine--D-glutamate ligase [Chloroflexota bacterium]